MTHLHSPGPWSIESSLSSEFRFTRYITDLAAHVVADVRPVEGDDQVELANARLIAAAPDLLAAVELCLKVIPHVPRHKGEDWDDALRSAWRACLDVAIKAKGEPT